MRHSTACPPGLAEGWEQGSLGASTAIVMGLLPLQDAPGWSEWLEGEETVLGAPC